MEKPEIEYPCKWACTVIGADEIQLQEAAKFAVGEKEYSFTASNRSSGSKYLSFKLELIVDDEAECLAIFEILKHDAAIKMVI